MIFSISSGNHISVHSACTDHEKRKYWSNCACLAPHTSHPPQPHPDHHLLPPGTIATPSSAAPSTVCTLRFPSVSRLVKRVEITWSEYQQFARLGCRPCIDIFNCMVQVAKDEKLKSGSINVLKMYVLKMFSKY